MDAKIKQKVLRLLTNGMYILTSRSAKGFGAATITWVSQASFKPPLLMTALRKDGSAFQCVVESRTAVLHVLDNSQQDIAQKFFAATAESHGSLNGEPYTEGTIGAPVLRNLGAYLECKALEILEKHGDHAIVVFEVVNAVLRRDVQPLTVSGSPWQYGG
jgi:flavin reductase (DIM6/NTAB) family NADH-FMN oxidoreductase RutF